MKKIAVLLISFVLVTSCTQTTKQQVSDPLPSWNEGASKQSIVDFVTSAVNQNSTSYIPEQNRIVVFDNDGTLWSEQPIYFQFAFAIDRVKALAPNNPEWKNEQPFKAILEGDINTALAGGEKALLEIVMATHSGMTTSEFEDIVVEWINTARHPKTGKLYKNMVFQPMLEVLDYLRANDFKTYIVSGGGIDFMRPWTEEVYGIPAEQVMGSSGKVKFQIVDGKPTLVKLPELNFIDDKEGKPIGIHYFIGKKPVAAFGNSDGDLAMLQFTSSSAVNSLMVYIHHTDAEREWAYDRNSHIGKLDKGLDEATAKGWTVVDMKNDWNRIYPE